MTPEQTRQIVDFISAAKNQTPTEKTYGAWHLLIAELDFEKAREATILALKDPSITFLEPKHILGKVSELKEAHELKLRQERAIEHKSETKGVPMPKCKHDIGLLYCDPCCHDEAVKQGLKTGPYKPRKTLEQLLS